MSSEFISGSGALTAATKKYIASHYQNPVIKVSAEVSPKLGYIPALQFKINSHLVALIEVSDTPYPAILDLRRVEIEDLQIPICVYCACPEEAYIARQDDVKRLIKHGFGLLTVSADGTVQPRATGIPLIQRIARELFQEEIKTLPLIIRRRLVEAYDKYVNSAPAGVADVSEVVEGLILTAGREAVKKNWLSSADVRPGRPADTLSAMQNLPRFNNASSAIGSVKGYMSEVRNNSHHFPKNPANAAKKYRECRHSFLEGLKRAVSFHGAMKNAGLSGSLK